jgi:hypothetical protein
MQTPAAVTTLDLQLQETGDGQSLAAQLLTPSALVRLPPIPLDIEGRPGDLLQRAQRWQRAFRTTHIAKVAGTEPRRVQEAGAELLAALQRLLAHPTWGALPQALERHPQLPLRIEIPTAASASRPPGHPLLLAEQLPWEDLPLNRPIWRICSAEPPSQRTPSPPQWRRPRLLVVVGPAKGLDVNAQMAPLRQLERGGRLELGELIGPKSSADNLRRCLADPRGWDGLVYLGHGEPRGGQVGLLALGDGSVLPGDNLSAAMAQATARGLSWMLLSSCHSSELVPLCLQAGVPWLLSFRDEVPDPIALAAFLPVLADLERGHSLPQAAASARAALERQFPGSSQLLCLVARRDAQPLRLPLRRRQLWRRRLAQSQRSQLRAAGVVLGLALGVYGLTGLGWSTVRPLGLANPDNFLLDHRLNMQTGWRLLRGEPDEPQPAAKGSPLVVLLLTPKVAYPAGEQRVSRDVIRKVLQSFPPQRFPMVGLDIRLDDDNAGPTVQPQETARLAGLIKQQNRQELFQICFPSNSAGRVAGDPTKSARILKQAGLQESNATMGVRYRDVPLQLVGSVSAVPCRTPGPSFASRMSMTGVELPGDGEILDWSLDWFGGDNPLIRVVPINTLDDLPDIPSTLPLGARVAVGVGLPSALGTTGAQTTTADQEADLFPVPSALAWRHSWQAIPETFDARNDRMPGALVQAVLAESHLRRSWLIPLSPLPTTALGAGLGVLLAAVLERRRSRMLALLLISLLAVPASFELALGTRMLVPLLFPLGALWATCLSRQEPRR